MCLSSSHQLSHLARAPWSHVKLCNIGLAAHKVGFFWVVKKHLSKHFRAVSYWFAGSEKFAERWAAPKEWNTGATVVQRGQVGFEAALL